MGLTEQMAERQRFVPDMGYTGPIRTRKECAAPAFADHKSHRIGLFRGAYWGDDGGLPGYVYYRKCVNCGREFGNAGFVPGTKAIPVEE
jgi:hypothetical protein